jgi:sensor c-di-GMP phosphodiesterase-like protein
VHLQTVAEGIEEARQVEGLRALGCQLGQGFYYAKALPPQEIDDLLSRQSSSELSLAATVISKEIKT